MTDWDLKEIAKNLLNGTYSGRLHDLLNVLTAEELAELISAVQDDSKLDPGH